MEIEDPRVDPAMVPEGSRAVVIAEHQDEYRDLPAIRTPRGQVITRWGLSPEERLKIANGEDVFVTLVCPGGVTPLWVSIGYLPWRETEEMI